MKKPFYFLVLILGVLTLSACGQQTPPHDQEWSSESQPEATETSQNTDSDTPEDPSVDDQTSEASSDSEAVTTGITDWTLDSTGSKMTWKGTKVGSDQSGTIEIKSGKLTADKDGPTDGEFVVDMTTIKDDKDQTDLVEHLKSDDFFSVAKFPESKFVITEIESATEDQFSITGDLTIRGITNPITFEASTEGSEAGKKLVVAADFNIDRAKWDIKFDSSSFFQNLGDKAISDEIEFTLDLVFEPQQA